MFIKGQVAKSQLYWDAHHKNTIITQWEWTLLHTRRIHKYLRRQKKPILLSQSWKESQDLQCALDLYEPTLTHSLEFFYLSSSFFTVQMVCSKLSFSQPFSIAGHKHLLGISILHIRLHCLALGHQIRGCISYLYGELTGHTHTPGLLWLHRAKFKLNTSKSSQQSLLNVCSEADPEVTWPETGV